MREYNCDILIIGAGFAGAILGFLLRKSGRAQRVKITVEGVVPILGHEIVFDYLNEIVGYSWYIPWEKEAVAGCSGTDKLYGCRHPVCTKLCSGVGRILMRQSLL